MTRKKISTEVETKVLIQSRRRCCVCYGLNKDDSVKKGQIAHLNKKRDDNRLDNLVFLCLAHHDQYDTTTSQSKNLTKNEVREFRKELYNQISEIWKRPLNLIKNQQTNLAKIISGKYLREGYNEQAELEIIYIGNKRIKVNGLSFWGTKNKYGPNIGELGFQIDLIENKAVFSEQNGSNLYRIFFEFNGNEIMVKEDYAIGKFGFNAGFGGLYEKIK